MLRYLVLFAFLVFSSCMSLKIIQHDNTIKLDNNNFQMLDGDYEMLSDTTSKYYSYSLWGNLNFIEEDTLENWKYYKVRLTVINKKRINVKVMLDSICIVQKNLKGHFKKGYFITKVYSKWKGIPIFCFTSSSSKYQLSLGSNQKLYLDSKIRLYAEVAIVGVSGDDLEFSNYYNKK